jgi:SAM-dependent methyltransferase
MSEPTVGAEPIVAKVRERYALIAEGKVSGCCSTVTPCCGDAAESVARGVGYDEAELAALPDGANMGLGCGAPVDLLDLRPGEAVLDLGSGGGIDAFIAARRVGSRGRVIGVDMTPEMVGKARAGAARAGLANVEFREGRLEALPVGSSSVDAVTSNCVINLVPDKAAVFREVFRVLRPGGRLVISDIVLDGELPERLKKDVLAWVGCVAGAVERTAYFAMLEDAGLGPVEVLKDVDYLGSLAKSAPEEARVVLERSGVEMEQVTGRVHSVTFRAVKPGAGR